MKEIYRKLCDDCEDIPLFLQAWWLDATAGSSWDAVVVEKGGKIEAALPYIQKRRLGLTVLTQPALTQYLGPWLAPAKGKRVKQLARQKELMFALIEKLPSHHLYQQNWSPRVNNWMPFFWKGFKQTTRYSYRLEDLSDLDSIWGGFQDKIKGDVRKAEKKGIKTRVIDDIELFLSLNSMVFERQGQAAPYSYSYVKNIDAAAFERGRRAIFVAEDEEGNAHAAVYLVWDKSSAYYLMGGGDPALRNSGATSLCLWEAIKFSATVTRSFDFEGSMIEPVERFVRAFGGEPTPFYSVSRTANRWLKMALSIRG